MPRRISLPNLVTLEGENQSQEELIVKLQGAIEKYSDLLDETIEERDRLANDKKRLH